MWTSLISLSISKLPGENKVTQYLAKTYRQRLSQRFSSRHPIIIVVDDFVRGTAIHIGELIDTPENIFEVARGGDVPVLGQSFEPDTKAFLNLHYDHSLHIIGSPELIASW
jgi:hypothetical protein